MKTFYLRIYGFFLQIGMLYNSNRTGLILKKYEHIIRIKPMLRGFYISVMITYRK